LKCRILVVLMLLLAACSQTQQVVDPAKLIPAGWEQYRLGEFDRAVNSFQAVLTSPESSEDDQLQALYGLGTTWSLRRPDNDPELAATFFDEAISRAPQHEVAAWSMLANARMKHIVPVGQTPDYEQLRAAYQTVIDAFPGHLAAQEALLYQQSTLIMTLDEEVSRQAIDTLRQFIIDNPDSKFLSAAHSLLANAYQNVDMQQERLNEEILAWKTREIDPTSPFQDQAWRYWLLATLAEFEVGDFDTARKFYGLLLEEYPTDIKKYSAMQALKRMDEIEQQLMAEEGGSS